MFASWLNTTLAFQEFRTLQKASIETIWESIMKYKICKINLIYKCKRAIKIHSNWKIRQIKTMDNNNRTKETTDKITETIEDIKKISSRKKSVDLDLLIPIIGKMKLDRILLLTLLFPLVLLRLIYSNVLMENNFGKKWIRLKNKFKLNITILEILTKNLDKSIKPETKKIPSLKEN